MKIVVCVFALCWLWIGTAGAITIHVSADTNNSSISYYGGSVENLLNDTFAYDAEFPTSATPAMVWAGASGFHGGESNQVDVVLSFILDTPFTPTASTTGVVVDVWGRSPDTWGVRDDNFDVILYNGDYSNAVASQLGLAVPGDPLPYVRSTPSPGIGDTFDRFQIIGHDMTAGGDNPFTLMEVRMGLPMAYTWTGGADGDWSNTTNWLAGLVPQADNAGSAGLTMNYAERVVFAGTNLPSMNVPGLGGVHDDTGSGKWSTPMMHINSGGAGGFSVVAGDKGFWTNVQRSRTVLTVGDGVGGGAENVDLTLTAGTVSLNRHSGGITHNFIVNSDGTLRFSGNLNFAYDNQANRWGVLSLAGGRVVANGAVINISNSVNKFVEFTTECGSFTAEYGGDFPDFSAVESSLGTHFVDNTGLAKSYFHTVDDGGSFTVTVRGGGGMFLLVR